VLAAPDELRVEVGVAGFDLVAQSAPLPCIGNAHRRLLGLLHHRLVLRGRDVPALRFRVLERLDALPACLLRHGAALLQEMNPIGRFGRALRASSSAISFLIASKTTANCSSYFSSIASIRRASSR